DIDEGAVEIFSFQTRLRKTVLKGGFLGRYLPSGHLVYIRHQTLFAVPFDLSRLATAGVPQPVLEDIGNSRRGCWSFDFSRRGSLVFCHPGTPPLSLFWLDRAGEVSPLRLTPGSSYAAPRFSPDGARLAFSVATQDHQDIWVQDLKRGTASRLSTLPGANDTPVWTADGSNILFRSAHQPDAGIYGVPADGSGRARRLLDSGTAEFPSSVSPDGKRLAIWGGRVNDMVFMAPVESDRGHLTLGTPEPVPQTRFN